MHDDLEEQPQWIPQHMAPASIHLLASIIIIAMGTALLGRLHRLDAR